MIFSIFILGLIVGSFLNVVGLRFRSGLTLGGRSFCPTCGKKLSPLELVPVLSYLFLRGRCSVCKAHISYQYPLIELWTGVVFASLYFVFGLTIQYLLLIAVFCIYTVILIYDLRHKIIPDSLVYLSIVISLVYRFLAHGTFVDWLMGPILFSAFGLIWLISRGRALGFGDAKLALSIGLLLGGPEGLSAIALAFWIGTLVTVPLMLFSRKGITMKSEIPFAPFMIFGAWVSVIFGFDLFHVQTLLN